MKKGDFSRPPFAVISIYVERCEECGSSVLNIAANLGVQISGCTHKACNQPYCISPLSI